MRAGTESKEHESVQNPYRPWRW